jgi:alkanesulfonate monooxygenase SsuD/methylene tetrahydromethanopterin reductase-like flavin-dependent oxidoreductase (luciferase family)
MQFILPSTGMVRPISCKGGSHANATSSPGSHRARADSGRLCGGTPSGRRTCRRGGRSGCRPRAAAYRACSVPSTASTASSAAAVAECQRAVVSKFEWFVAEFARIRASEPRILANSATDSSILMAPRKFPSEQQVYEDFWLDRSSGVPAGFLNLGRFPVSDETIAQGLVKLVERDAVDRVRVDQDLLGTPFQTASFRFVQV